MLLFQIKKKILARRRSSILVLKGSLFHIPGVIGTLSIRFTEKKPVSYTTISVQIAEEGESEDEVGEFIPKSNRY